MRTRNQSKKQSQSAGALTNTSRKGVEKLLEQVDSGGPPWLNKEDNVLRHCDYLCESGNGSKGKESEVLGTSMAEASDDDVKFQSPSTSFQPGNPDSDCVMDESDWEDGSNFISNSPNGHTENTIKGVTIEFETLVDTPKRKPVRRVSAEEKELAELVHRAHLLCLLGRGRLIDAACSDPLTQAALLSLLPAHLVKISEVSKLTATALAPLVNWFHDNFPVRNSYSTGRPVPSALLCALESREGTPEEITALSVTMFRALNLSTRFVSILDATSLKVNAENSESISQHNTSNRGIFDSSTMMVSRSYQVSKSPIKHSGYVDMENTSKASLRDKSELKRSVQLNDVPCEVKNDISEACLTKKPEGSKRIGDLEFEMQLEMAISATATSVSESNFSSDIKDLQCNTTKLSSFKRLKRIRSEEASSSVQGISTAFGSKKTGPPTYWAEVFCSGENSNGKWVHIDVVNAIVDGELKVEAAAAACKVSLRYVVAFAGQGAKDVTRRYCAKWYKIASQRVNSIWWDAVLAPLKELESRATGGVLHLKEESLQEHGDANSLCAGEHSSLVHASDENAEKKIGFSYARSSFVATRTSIEDMELETKALTEPLPTNQQAYRNHQLYALERWLTKYQILHPKGPVLGFCSGHPVYPRTCVQTLHTKERWLREGLQIKADELPAKVLKRLMRTSKPQISEPNDYDEDHGGTGGTISLYGKWQTEPLRLSRAVNGIVPKNERGRVDVWSEKCLPPGTVHLRLPRVYSVAKRLEIDYAPAMVGFEFKNGRSFPEIDGIVVCAEFKDVILEAYAEEEERRKAGETKRNEANAISRWYQLLSAIVTRRMLNNRYGDGGTLKSSNNLQQTEEKDVRELTGGNQETSKSVYPRESVHNSKTVAATRPAYAAEDHHEHVFSTHGQSSGTGGPTRTKRCRCGFSIQVEEL